MSEKNQALPVEGWAKLAQKPAKIYEITRRDRFLLAGVLVWCFLTVDSSLWAWPYGMGLTATVFGWYILLFSALGPSGLQYRENQVLLIVNLALAVSFALSSNSTFHIWNFFALLVLIPSHAWGLSGGTALPWWHPLMLWERFCLLLRGLFGALGAAFAAVTPQKGGLEHRRILAAVLGITGALALLGLLVPILSSADALFAAATADLRRFIREHLTESLWKWIMALILTPFVCGLIYRLRHPAPAKAPAIPALSADGLLFLIILAALDGLYLLFLLVQSAGLFGGAAYLAQRGISYAEWARSGFFQMVGVTVVNLTVIMAALTLSRQRSRGWTAVRLLSAALTAESLVLLVSAAWRMTLYVSAYGLSFKRLLTYWGMGMMALLFLAVLWKTHKPDFRFCRTAFPLALAGWLVINCIPADYLVAKNQVDRYLDGESTTLSVHYLAYALSYDALSQLERLDSSLPLYTLEGNWWAPGETLGDLLAQRRAAAQRECSDWRSWSLSACLAGSRD